MERTLSASTLICRGDMLLMDVMFGASDYTSTDRANNDYRKIKVRASSTL